LKKFDIIILGGGPAGTSTAISLFKKGFSVLLIDKKLSTSIKYGESLIPKAREPLLELGVWELFLNDQHSPSHGILSAWGNDKLAENNFIYNPYGNGWNLNRPLFDSRLLEAAKARGAQVVETSSHYESLADNQDQWEVTLKINEVSEKFISRFIVDATGRASLFAKKRGAHRILTDHLVGIAAIVESSPHSNESSSQLLLNSTLIESQENGWWYSAPLPGNKTNNKTVAIFMTDAELYSKSKKQEIAFWEMHLALSTYARERLGKIKFHSMPKPVAAFSSSLYHAAGKNWMAVGDAALSLDPLSSQGIYKALISGIEVSQWIANQLEHPSSNPNEVAQNYSQSLDEAYQKYLTARKNYHSKEQRWAQSPFWKRRQSV